MKIPLFCRHALASSLLLALATSLLSCSHMQSKRLDDEEETLRALSISREAEIPWTDELEADRLTLAINTTEGIEKRVALSPLSVLANTEEKSILPLYPQLDWLGKLDYSAFPEAARTVLDNFCEAFIAGEKTEQYVTSQGRYLLALFYHDIATLITPLKPVLPAKEEATTEETATEVPADFTSFRYGAPFVSADFLQVPAQFSGDFATMNASIILIREKDAWKVDQIQIRKWEEKQ